MSKPHIPNTGRGGHRTALACGRDPVEVVDRARAGRSRPHEQNCPYCQAAIAADEPSARAAGQLAATEADQPVPDTLLPKIMQTVWAELRRSTMIPLPAHTGTALITGHAGAAVIEHALDQLLGLRVRTCTVTVTRADGASPADGPTDTTTDDALVSTGGTARIAVAVTAAAAYGADVPALARQARDIVRAAAAEQFGWNAEPVDIEIVDIYLPGAQQ